ncbi:MAG: class C sortase [Firmicutes bacterium]|nr:class C sortase [Bacillota bacterium]
MKKQLSTILLVIVFITGLSLLLYPTISDYWNSFHQSRAIANYAEDVVNMNDTDYNLIWNDAEEYNSALKTKQDRYTLSDEEKNEYDSLLNISGSGIMGYIEIPEIKCSLPIYHGTNDAVLQIAVGHIAGTSLPTGGEGTHCVLSGHRGLPSAKLFSDLDKLSECDVFILRILDEVLTYEVDQIRIVEPYEIEELEIVEGKDYCTLVTCTPYGINTHRLLVRGHRVENLANVSSVRVTADAMQIEPLIVAPAVAVPMLLLLLIIVYIEDTHKRRKKRGGKSYEK